MKVSTKKVSILLAMSLVAGIAACGQGASPAVNTQIQTEQPSGPITKMIDQYIQGTWTCEHSYAEGSPVQYKTTINVKDDHSWTIASKSVSRSSDSDQQFHGTWAYRAGTITFKAEPDTPVDGGGHTVSSLPEILQMVSGQPLVQTISYTKSTRGDLPAGSMTTLITPTSFKARYTDAKYSSNDFFYSCMK